MTDQDLKDLFEQESRLVAEDARVPAAGSIWWRSAMRARRDAAESAMRPLLWFQAIAAAAVLGAIAAAIGIVWPSFRRLAGVTFLEAMGPWTLPLIAVLGVCVAAVPAVLYFALREGSAPTQSR